MIDPVEFGKTMGAIVREATAPLLKRIEELEARQPERGEPGPPGEPGQDAEPVVVADVVAELVKSDLLAPILDLYVEERVTKHFEDNPIQHGKDAPPVSQEVIASVVKDYLTANPPAPGRDGLDVKDLFRADGGKLVAVLSDGTTKDLGQFVGKDGRDGEDGKDGRDGMGFEDAVLELADDHAVLKLSRGDVVKSLVIPLPTMKHIGFWQAGMKAKASETTTHDGSLWLALRNTEQTPAYDSTDWQLAARKGSDGKRGADGKDYKPSQPVNLKGGNNGD